jgi:hypothetical protein
MTSYESEGLLMTIIFSSGFDPEPTYLFLEISTLYTLNNAKMNSARGLRHFLKVPNSWESS